MAPFIIGRIESMEGINTNFFKARGQELRKTVLPLLSRGDRDSWAKARKAIAEVEEGMTWEEKEAFESGLYYRDDDHQIESETVGALLNVLIKE